MPPTTLSVSCPNCAHELSLDEILTSRIRDEFKQDFEVASRRQELEIKTREEELLKREADMLKEASAITQKIEEQVAKEKARLTSELKTQATAEAAMELSSLKDQLAGKDEKLKDFQQEQLDLLKQKAELEEKQQSLELQVQRQVEEKRSEIREAALKDYQERNHWELQQREKTIHDLNKKVEEMALKISQGSQQSQGEVVELELETTLRTLCPLDEIKPVGKGVNGADVIQLVRNRGGQECGTIIWEFKNTRNWSAGWIAKVKEDQRREKAEFAVIVSMALPDSIKTFGQIEGVWVSRLDCIAGLVLALREQLSEVQSVRVQGENRQDKMAVLYDYVAGTQFRQRVETIAEAFTDMQSDLLKEKNIYQKIWAKREAQLGRVVQNLFGMHGDFHGLIGASMPEISLLMDGAEDEEAS